MNETPRIFSVHGVRYQVTLRASEMKTWMVRRRPNA
jgi:hypothetical protein